MNQNDFLNILKSNYDFLIEFNYQFRIADQANIFTFHKKLEEVFLTHLDKFKSHSQMLTELMYILLYILDDKKKFEDLELDFEEFHRYFLQRKWSFNTSKDLKSKGVFIINGHQSSNPKTSSYFKDIEKFSAHLTKDGWNPRSYLTSKTKKADFKLESESEKILVIACHGSKDKITFSFSDGDKDFYKDDLLNVIDFNQFNYVLFLFCTGENLATFIDSKIPDPIYLSYDNLWLTDAQNILATSFFSSLTKYSFRASGLIAILNTIIYLFMDRAQAAIHVGDFNQTLKFMNSLLVKSNINARFNLDAF